MGYCSRVLSTSDKCVSFDWLFTGLKETHPECEIKIDSDNPDLWDNLIIDYNNKQCVVLIERHPVEAGSIGEEEIKTLLDEIQEEKPDSAVEWLNGYLPQIKTIYAFQFYSSDDSEIAFEIFLNAKFLTFEAVPSIMQSYFEGYTNEDGYNILMQFSDEATFEWEMALLKNNEWVNFSMDLGSKWQRTQFNEGNVPLGAKLF